ncbi:MAG: hypothetical protein NTW87_35135 [Planctomycetota bacterium]|nr:hypothetical protein [Planctomycetota bacterium]
MKALGWVCLGLGGLSALVAATAEAMGGERRWAVYAGGAAGIVVSLAGLPFAWKLSRLADAPARDTRFWKWWGGGLLVRLVLVAGLAFGLLWYLKPRANAALLTMGAVYLFGMLAEAAWVARVFFRAAKGTRPGERPERGEGP